MCICFRKNKQHYKCSYHVNDSGVLNWVFLSQIYVWLVIYKENMEGCVSSEYSISKENAVFSVGSWFLAGFGNQVLHCICERKIG